MIAKNDFINFKHPYFWVPKAQLMYLLVMLQLKLAQKKPYLESWLTQNSVLTNMFLQF